MVNITLLHATAHPDDALITARWSETVSGVTLEHNSLHDSNGRCLASGRDFRAPHLSAEQVANAHIARHPAYELAEKGAASRPDLAERMTKAADLVAGGQVSLTSEVNAIANGHVVTASSCDCKDFEFRAPGGWCKHRLAVRMARSLNQPLFTDEVEVAKRAERRKLELEEMAKRETQADKAHRQWLFNSAEGARRYTLKAMANGAGTVKQSVGERLVYDSAELEATKAAVLARLGLS